MLEFERKNQKLWEDVARFCGAHPLFLKEEGMVLWTNDLNAFTAEEKAKIKEYTDEFIFFLKQLKNFEQAKSYISDMRPVEKMKHGGHYVGDVEVDPVTGTFTPESENNSESGMRIKKKTASYIIGYTVDEAWEEMRRSELEDVNCMFVVMDLEQHICFQGEVSYGTRNMAAKSMAKFLKEVKNMDNYFLAQEVYTIYYQEKASRNTWNPLA